MELLHFIFSSFWSFAGAAILLLIIASVVETICNSIIKCTALKCVARIGDVQERTINTEDDLK